MKYKEEHMLRTFNSPYLPNHFYSIVVYSPILLSTLGALGFFLASLLIPDGWQEAATARNNEPRKHRKLYQNVSAVYQMIDMSRVDLSARVSFFRLRGPVASCSPSKIFWNALQSEKQQPSIRLVQFVFTISICYWSHGRQLLHQVSSPAVLAFWVKMLLDERLLTMLLNFSPI